MIFQLIIASIVLGVAVFLINFYRDPKRFIPRGQGVVSPADGKVIRILKTTNTAITVPKGLAGKIKTLTKDIGADCYVISIFMSPFDVHVNRAPIGGKVLSSQHTPGRFFAAYNLKKSLMNEKQETIIHHKFLGNVKVIQIAGFLARRIICKVKKNDKLNKGQKMGKIVLGSQVTLILNAKKTRLVITPGQRVQAGASIIAYPR